MTNNICYFGPHCKAKILSMFRFIPVFIFLTLLNQVDGQKVVDPGEDKAVKRDYEVITGYQADYLNALYAREVATLDELINGREYIPYYLKCKKKPLLFEEKKRSGSLLFNGRKYNNLSLEYDTYLDKLIYYDSLKFIDDKQFKIALNPDLVGGFSLFFQDDSMNFRYFRTDDGGTFNLPEGFYEVVYDGKTRCIIKHQSFLTEKDGLEEYSYSHYLYVIAGGKFIKVRSSADFIKLFGKNSDVVKKYMHVNRVHFRRAGKNEIAAVLRYFDAYLASDK